MKENIHPQWFPSATVICACGNSWTTGATQAELRTDICSACHPFYTGEQRIVDTEGQIDRFVKRLQLRDAKRQEQEDRVASRTSPSLPLSDLDINKRYVGVFAEAGIETAGDFITRLETDGDEKMVELPGIGRKMLADVKKALRARGYELPTTAESAAE